MHLWYTLFRQADPLPGMPQISHVFCSRRGPGYGDRGHDRHDTGYAFQYTLRGKGILRIRGREVAITPGVAFFRRVDDAELEHHYAGDDDDPWEFVFCDLEAPGFSVMGDAVIGRYGHVYEMPLEHPFIQRLLGFRRPQNGSLVLSLGDNLQLVAELLTALAESAPDVPCEGGHTIIDEVQRLIRNTDPNIVNVTWLSRQLDVSREHLARLCRSQLQRTPRELITEQRVQIACQLLAATDLQIQHVAFQCGFGRAEFSSWFRRQCGESPSTYRRSRRA